MSRYLVTGGLGVIGSHIAGRLISAGHDVQIIDCGGGARHLFNGKAIDASGSSQMIKGCFVRLEEMPTEDLADLVDKADFVIHAAAHTGIPHSVTDPHDDWQSNVDATRNLLEALRIAPTPTVVLSSVKPYRVLCEAPCLACNGSKSSGSSYLGHGGGPCPECRGLGYRGLREEDPLDPDEPYAASKAAQSMLCVAYARSYKVPVVTLRCSNLYGPAACHGPRHGWVTWFCIAAAIGHPIAIQGDGEQTRDILHATDVHDACRRSLLMAGELRGRIFNIGGGHINRVSVRSVISQLQTLGADLKTVDAEARRLDDRHVFADHGAFTRATGWTPTVSAAHGVREVYRWAVANANALRTIYQDAT